MAVRLLLDEHLALPFAPHLRRRGIDAVSMQEWQGGIYLSKPDADILLAAQPESRTLVTFDVGSIPRLTGELAESAVEHAGVVLISRKTFKQDDVGSLMRALERFAAQYQDVDLRNQVLYLARQRLSLTPD